jgi:hypothetical protein
MAIIIRHTRMYFHYIQSSYKILMFLRNTSYLQKQYMRKHINTILYIISVTGFIATYRDKFS